MTSSREIGSRLSRTCDRSHSHQPLLGKVKHDGTWHARSRLAQEYPDEFCRAICRGLQAEKESRLQARAVYCVLAREDMGLSGSDNDKRVAAVLKRCHDSLGHPSLPRFIGGCEGN